MQSLKKQKREVSQESSKYEKDLKAVQILNEIKDKYAKQIRVLTNLKREVTQTEELDQGQKSSLRIQIESILIDLNEEIFAISEELAAAFQGSKTDAKADEIYQRAMEFEQKKILLLSKIRKSISNNPLTKVVKGEALLESAGRVSHSPPQRESSSNVMRLIKKYSDSKSPISKHNSSFGQASRKSSQSLFDRREGVKTSDVSPLRFNQLNQESIETFGNLGNSNSPRLKMKFQFQNKYDFDENTSNNQHLKKQKKSPSMPLRNRQNNQTSTMSLSSIPSDAPNISKVRSRQQKPKPLAPSDKRQTQRQISQQANNTKKALNKMYTVDSIKSRKRSLSRNSRGNKDKQNMIPKYAGCGPGGMNSSLTVNHRSRELKDEAGMNPQKTTLLGMTLNSLNKSMQPLINNNRGSVTINSSRVSSTKKLSSDTKTLNLKHNDKNLRQARKDTTELYKAEREASQIAVQKSIDMFKNFRQIEKEESFQLDSKVLEKSQSFQSRKTHHQLKQEKAMSSQDFSKLPQISQEKTMSSFDYFEQKMKGEDKILITQSSDAVVQFSKEFDLMRKKFGEMHNEMINYKQNIQGLNSQVTHLRDENLKLNTDVKVIRTEHNDVLYTVRKLETKNQQLIKENLTLKDILYERRARGFENQKEVQNFQSSTDEQRYNETLSEHENHDDQREPQQLITRGRPLVSFQPTQFNQNQIHNSSINSMNSRSPSNDGYSRRNQHALRTKNSLDREKGFTKIIESPFNNALHKLSSGAKDIQNESKEAVANYIQKQRVSNHNPKDSNNFEFNSGRDEQFSGKFPSKSESNLTSHKQSQYSALRHQNQSSHLESFQPERIFSDQGMEPVIQSEEKAVKYISYVHTTNSPQRNEQNHEADNRYLQMSPDGKLSDWVLERMNKAKNRD